MRYIISTARGTESIASEELKEIIKDFSNSDNFFFCETSEPEKLKALQSAYHVIKIVSESDNFESLFDYPEADEEKNLKSFYCSSPREYKEDLIEALSKKKYLKFSHPDIYYFLLTLKHKFYLGIDMFGDLSKRDYRIFTTRFSLKGPVAYAFGAYGLKINDPPKKAAIIITTDGSEAIEFIKKFPGTEAF
jgi:23S rRNA G2445 N2-methylase RlmL